jgi:hypothetical protein
MPDRYVEAARYRAQTFWPIPCEPGSKKAAVLWTVYQKRVMTVPEMHDAWPLHGNNNIALVLGPAAHLLALNVNMKHGHNGRRTLNGYPLPATPTILTPHDGFAYLFRVPDREHYPFGFTNHPSIRDLPGIELRGAGGYQLVPSSHVDATARDPAGDYRFDPGWTLTRLMLDLVDLPAWLLDLWITLDRGAKIFGRDEPTTIGNAQKPLSAAGLPTDLSPPSPHTPQNRSQARPPHTAHNNKPRDLSSGAPVLLETNPTIKSLNSYAIRRLFGDWDANAAAAQFLGLGRAPATLLCWNHPDTTPSMSLYVEQRTGAWKIHDWHDDAHYALADIFARHIIGHTVRLKGTPTLATWWKRLLLACKYLDAPDVPRQVLPQDARQSVVQVYEGFLLNVACHWLTQPGCAVPFTQGFAIAWCGMKSKHLVEYALYRLRHDGQMRPAGRQNGSQVFLPGEG